MDSDYTNDTPEQPQPPESWPIPPVSPPPAVPKSAPVKKRSGWNVFWGILFAISVLGNLFLFLGLIFLAVFAAANTAGSAGRFFHETLIEGNPKTTVAVIAIDNVIDPEMSDRVRNQLHAAGTDTNVKAVIIRIVSPGGYVSSSDQIYYEIQRFREKTGKPVVAFMQTVAASGGYYSAVACDTIISEPTVITGSIGVIMSHLVVQELLEDKLGIEPVVIKSGEKKDWPSMFSTTTPEQQKYLKEKLIGPAYERFVDVVAEGRQKVLTRTEILELADGSIYPAQEALDKSLIDDIGYFQDAVDLARNLAGIGDGRVIEYYEKFTLWQHLAAQNKSELKFDRSTLQEFLTPQLMYIWDGRE